MKLLLDTCVLLWWLNNSDRLGTKIINTINNSNNQAYVSSASIWEIYIKQAAGKLTIDGNLIGTLETLDIKPLPIMLEHGKIAAELPSIHRDPFDRMLIAQASAEKMTIVTADRRIQQYPVSTLKVR